MTTPFVLITAHHIQPDRADEVRLMAAPAELIGKGIALTEGNVRIDVLGPPGPVLNKALENNRANGVQVTVAEQGLGGFAREMSA